jgi:hypothetical protein
VPGGEISNISPLFDYRICSGLLPIQFCKKTDDVYQIYCVVFIDERLFCLVHKPATSADGGKRAGPALVPDAASSADLAKNVDVVQSPELRPIPAVIEKTKYTKKPAHNAR